MERTHAEARARIPMTADQVRGIIAEMEAAGTRKSARIKLAELAIRVGNITDEGKEVYRAYAEKLRG
jgi:phage terminase large subunit-like protein